MLDELRRIRSGREAATPRLNPRLPDVRDDERQDEGPRDSLQRAHEVRCRGVGQLRGIPGPSERHAP